MIYINNNTTNLIVPKFVNDTPYKIVFTGQTDKNQYTFELYDNTPNNKVCYTLPVSDDMRQLKTGQYDYAVTSIAGDILSSGILQIGEFTVEQTKYNVKKDIVSYEG